MSWNLKKKVQTLLADEQGTFRKEWGGKVAIALVYPNTDEMRRTETAPFSLESQRPLADFDMIGFSVTYEGDYINTLRLLHLAGIPLRAVERRPGDPLVLM